MLIFSLFLSTTILLNISFFFTTQIEQEQLDTDETTNQSSLSNKSKQWNRDNVTFSNITRSHANPIISTTLAQNGTTPLIGPKENLTAGGENLKEAANVTGEPLKKEKFFNRPSVDSNKSSFIAVDIIPDRKDYTEFEDIEIWVYPHGNSSDLLKLLLEVRDSNNTLIHKSSQIANASNNYTFNLHPGKVGLHNVTVEAIQGTKNETASTTFNVVSIFTTNSVIFIYFSVINFSALMILITRSKIDSLLQEILRFVFLSGIVASLISSLLFTDMELGRNSPIGLIKLPQNEEKGYIQEWVFSIGNALTIPIYVIVFGLFGGYIRYLVKYLSRSNDEDKGNESKSKKTNNQPYDKNFPIKKETKSEIEEERRKKIFYESLHDIALFFLAPLLAMAVYFLLFALGLSDDDNSIYTIAVISFTVGLVTENVIQRLIGFTTQNALNSQNNNQLKTTKSNDEDINNLSNTTDLDRK
jgi:hypothetical protein